MATIDNYLKSITQAVAKLQKADTLDNHAGELSEIDELLWDLVSATTEES